LHQPTVGFFKKKFDKYILLKYNIYQCVTWVVYIPGGGHFCGQNAKLFDQ